MENQCQCEEVNCNALGHFNGKVSIRCLDEADFRLVRFSTGKPIDLCGACSANLIRSGDHESGRLSIQW